MYKLIKSIFIFMTTFTFFLFADNAYSKSYKIAGGPDGGTFKLYAKAISTMAAKNRLRIIPYASVGSIDNIRKIENKKAQFAIAYSGHVFQAINGTLRDDTKKYNKIMAIGYLYGALAHLCVRSQYGISSAQNIRGLKIGIGDEGSGAADTAELFFRAIDLWDTVRPHYYSYQKTIDTFVLGKIHAFWLFTGCPNPAVISASKSAKISLLDVYSDAKAKGLFTKYPYYTKAVIPLNTYSYNTKDIETFQDSTILIARKFVPNKVVIKLLEIIYSDKGLKMLAKNYYISGKLTIKDGLKGIVTPLHPGAIEFWKKNGILK